MNKKQILAVLKYNGIQDSRNRINAILTARIEDYRSKLHVSDLKDEPMFTFSNFYITSGEVDSRRYGNKVYNLLMDTNLMIKDVMTESTK